MTNQQTRRATNGQFAPGNPGGPGRPRRAVELEYLGIVADCCPMPKWRAIVRQAVAQAEQGDAQARRFLAQYLLGESGHLLQLAAREKLGIGIDDEVDAAADELADRNIERIEGT